MVMVKQTRIVFSPGDLREASVRCAHCKGTVGRPVGCEYKVPECCPMCGARWKGRSHEDIQSLLVSIRQVAGALEPALTLELELDGEESCPCPQIA